MILTQAIPELERLDDDLPPYSHVCELSQHCLSALPVTRSKPPPWSGKPIVVIPSISLPKSTMRTCVFSKGEIGKVPGIFDHACDLQQLYPHRTRFHVSEFTGFAWVMCRYFCAIGERETAALYYQMLKHVAPRHPMTKHAKRVTLPTLLGQMAPHMGRKKAS